MPLKRVTSKCKQFQINIIDNDNSLLFLTVTNSVETHWSQSSLTKEEESFTNNT